METIAVGTTTVEATTVAKAAAATTAPRVPQVPVLLAPETTRLHPLRACPDRVLRAAPKPALQDPVPVVPVRLQGHPVRALRVRQVLLVQVAPVPALRVPVVPAPLPA